MEVKTIRKYDKYSTPQLIKKLTVKFNRHIRERDAGKGCISCNSPAFTDAGHFYSAGHYPALRFNENNVHGQCRRCNHFLSGNLIEYRNRLKLRIGEDAVNQLDLLASHYKRFNFKWSRIELIELLEKY